MKFMQKLLLALGLLQVVSFSYAMEEAKKLIRESKPVKLPSTQTLKERLTTAGFDHFVEKTAIDKRLGGLEKHPIEVLAAVKESLSDYAELVTDQQAKGIHMLKPSIMKTIFQDSPEVAAAFAQFYSQAQQLS